jgi:DNA replication and repair protein RecF
MPFTRIRSASFRNLEDDETEVAAERIFLVGENGQGKTNFLEAIYFLSYGSSFRGPVESEAGKRGGIGFSLSGRSRLADSSLGMPDEEIAVSWQDRAKQIRHNGKPIADRKELVELNPVVVFCHEDFAFASGEPERRRFFFDQTAGLVSPEYIDALRDYKRILKQRNAALRENRVELLEHLDLLVAGKGLELVEARTRLHAELDERFTQRYEAVSLLGREVRLRYRSNWNLETGIDGVLEKLRNKRAEELALGTSLSGPHRDRWTFVAGDADFASTASTGQLRLLSLVLRMVQAEHYSAARGRLPILLLDDVLLELDRGKRRRFLELLPPSGQSFSTFLPGEPWEEYRNASTLVFEVKNGRLKN